MDSWNGATGALSAWVQVPQISSAADTVLYACYGNGAISSSQATRTTYDANYMAVWHLSDGVTFSANDSSPNLVNPGSLSTVTATAGKIGGAGNFPGNAALDYNSPALDTFSSLTVSFWMKAVAGENSFFVNMIHHSGMWKITTGGPGGNYPALLNNGQGNLEWPYIGDNAWHKLDWTLDGTSSKIYFDGVLTQQTTSPVQPWNTPGTVRVGGPIFGCCGSYKGLLDELRLAKTARPAEWLATEFANQNAAATFAVFGAEASQVLSVTPPAVSLTSNQTQQFTASVPATCLSNLVNWSITPALGSISNTGLYTAPASNVSPQTVVVTATSQGDASATATASVLLLASQSITLSPGAVTIYAGSTLQFNATVTGGESGATRRGFRGERENDSGLKMNAIPGST